MSRAILFPTVRDPKWNRWLSEFAAVASLPTADKGIEVEWSLRDHIDAAPDPGLLTRLEQREIALELLGYGEWVQSHQAIEVDLQLWTLVLAILVLVCVMTMADADLVAAVLGVLFAMYGTMRTLLRRRRQHQLNKVTEVLIALSVALRR